MIDRTLCRYTPPRNGRLPTAISAVLLVGGFALWGALPKHGLWALARMGAILPITAGVYLAMRWLARIYTYSLEQHENVRVDFVVTEQNGFRCAAVCRIALDTITAVTQQSRRRPRFRGKMYHYLNAPHPKKAWILTFADPDGDRYIRITPNKDFLRLLMMLSPIEKSREFFDEFGKNP